MLATFVSRKGLEMKCTTEKSENLVTNAVTVATTEVVGRGEFVVVATRPAIAMTTIDGNIITRRDTTEINMFTKKEDSTTESMHMTRGQERSIIMCGDDTPLPWLQYRLKSRKHFLLSHSVTASCILLLHF